MSDNSSFIPLILLLLIVLMLMLEDADAQEYIIHKPNGETYVCEVDPATKEIHCYE